MAAGGAAQGLEIGDWTRNCARQMVTRSRFAADDIDAAKGYIATLTQGRSRFSASGSRRGTCFVGAHARLGGTGFEFLGYHWTADCETLVTRPPGHDIILYFPLSGRFVASQGGVDRLVGPGEILIAGAEGELLRRWSGSCELLNIVVTQEALARVLAADFGMRPDRALRIEPLLLSDADRAATLFRYVETVVSDLAREHSVFAETVAGSQAERTLLHIVIKCIFGDAVDMPERRSAAIAPYYVRRAEHFIRAHIEQAISIEQLIGCAGVSARTLFYGFKKYRQSSPMQYIKRLRLVAARDLLLAARFEGCRIGEVAERLGYQSLSQFSRDYRRQFGESPRATLGRAGVEAGRNPGPAG